MAEEKKQWYVLRAISGKEAKVKEVLEAQMRNTDLGRYLFQVLIPTEKVLTVRNGKKVVKEKNLYSGYVFIEATLHGEVVLVGTPVKYKIHARSVDASGVTEYVAEADKSSRRGAMSRFADLFRFKDSDGLSNAAYFGRGFLLFLSALIFFVGGVVFGIAFSDRIFAYLGGVL